MAQRSPVIFASVSSSDWKDSVPSPVNRAMVVRMFPISMAKIMSSLPFSLSIQYVHDLPVFVLIKLSAPGRQLLKAPLQLFLHKFLPFLKLHAPLPVGQIQQAGQAVKMRGRVRVRHAQLLHTLPVQGHAAPVAADAVLHHRNLFRLIIPLGQDALGHLRPVDVVVGIQAVIGNRRNIVEPCRNHHNLFVRPVPLRKKSPVFNHCLNMIVHAHPKLIGGLLTAAPELSPQIIQNIISHLYTPYIAYFITGCRSLQGDNGTAGTSPSRPFAQIFARMISPIFRVPMTLSPARAISAVRQPSASALSTAASMASASAARWKE